MMVSALLCSIFATLSLVDATNGTKPNILLIVADDLGYSDVNFYPNSQSVVLTPNLRELAMGGIRLANHHVQPFCSPTRATIMVGSVQVLLQFWHTQYCDTLVNDRGGLCLFRNSLSSLTKQIC